MAKKTKNGNESAERLVSDSATRDMAIPPVAPEQSTAPVSLIKEFRVPPEQQEALRKSDSTGSMIQKELGSLEIQYVQNKSNLLRAFDANRKEYEELLKAAGKAVGIDFDKLTGKERWEFNFNTMTFKHVDTTDMDS